MSTAFEQTTLGEAVARAKKLLQGTDCAGLFNIGGKGPDPSSLLASLSEGGSYGAINFGNTNGNNATTIPLLGALPDPNGQPEPDTVAITLNEQKFQGWHIANVDERAFTLLHELGHAYALLFGAGTTRITGPDNPTLGPEAAQRQLDNKTAIRTNCK